MPPRSLFVFTCVTAVTALKRKNEKTEISWQPFWENPQALQVASIVSLISSGILCVLYFLLPHVRRTPGQYILHATLCDIVSSILVCLVISQYSSLLQASGIYRIERELAILILTIAMLEIAANVYRSLKMYSKLILIYRNPFRPERHHRFYALSLWLAACVTVGTFSQEFYVHHCDSWRIHCREILSTVLIFAPFTVYMIGGAMYISVRLLLEFGTDRGTRHASISDLARQRVSRHGLAYLLLYGVQHCIGLAGALALYWNPRLKLLKLFLFFMCMRPTLSFIGWMMINDVLYIVFGVCSFTKRRPSLRRAVSASPMETQIALASISNVGGSFTSGKTNTTKHTPEDKMNLKGGREEKSLRPAMQRQGMEDGFKEELRFELLYDIACSIGNLADHEFRAIGTGSGSGSPEAKSAAPTLTSTFSYPARKMSWMLISPKNSNAAQSHHLASAGLLSVQGEDQMHLNMHLNMPLKGVQHYGEAQFRRIREAFGIKPFAYAREFPNQLSEYDAQWRQKLKESLSEGASGSFFYRVMNNDSSVCNSHFIVKQISMEETRTLKRILNNYENHVTQRKGRSLIQYLGCHSLRLRWRYSGSVHFVVMRNFLPVKPWLCFDLKGATANRRALAHELLHGVGTDPRGGTVYGTLRDWEWMDIAMVTDLSPQQKAEIAEMVAADAEFLKQQRLLDYSLLLGIHRLPHDLGPAAREKKLKELEAVGGYVSVDRQKVYFFGIIDILEQFSLRWKIQHLVLQAAYRLSCRSGVDGISALPPAQYADRFFTFVQQEVLLDWSGEEEHTSDDDDTSSKRCFCWCRSGKGRGRQLGGISGGERWGQLWQRRRRGLVRERMDVERADFLRRIEDLDTERCCLLRRVKELEGQLQERAR